MEFVELLLAEWVMGMSIAALKRPGVGEAEEDAMEVRCKELEEELNSKRAEEVITESYVTLSFDRIFRNV